MEFLSTQNIGHFIGRYLPRDDMILWMILSRCGRTLFKQEQLFVREAWIISFNLRSIRGALYGDICLAVQIRSLSPVPDSSKCKTLSKYYQTKESLFPVSFFFPKEFASIPNFSSFSLAFSQLAWTILLNLLTYIALKVVFQWGLPLLLFPHQGGWIVMSLLGILSSILFWCPRHLNCIFSLSPSLRPHIFLRNFLSQAFSSSFTATVSDQVSLSYITHLALIE